jgi:hypothetical protein
MQPVGDRGGVPYLQELLGRRYDDSGEVFTWQDQGRLHRVGLADEVFRYACFLSEEKVSQGEPVTAARVALTVAHRYPPARVPLAKALLVLQLQAFAKWEEKYGKGPVGVRLLEWAIRVQRALGQDTREVHALQLLYLPAETQDHLLAARDEFLTLGQTDRVEQAEARLLTFSSARPNDRLPPIVPLCALTEHPWLTVPLASK